MRSIFILLVLGLFTNIALAEASSDFEIIPGVSKPARVNFVKFGSNTHRVKTHPIWQIIPGISSPVRTGLSKYRKNRTEVREILKLRIKIKKFVVTKTPQGPNIKFSSVCEIPGSTEVMDLTGGGLISEEVLGACDSLFKGKPVTVVLSGMVYDNLVADFSDESEATTRNLFAHLSLSSSDFIFGLGDFNLDNTRDLESEHFASHLSVDPKFGGSGQVREGFTVTVRYAR